MGGDWSIRNFSDRPVPVDRPSGQPGGLSAPIMADIWSGSHPNQMSKPLTEDSRRMISVKSGFSRRPANLWQPARGKQSRREFRCSVPFVKAYASLVFALHLPKGIGSFPDNYCLGRGPKTVKNWFYVTREPSLRAARRMVAMGLENPGLVATSLPYTVKEMSMRTPSILTILMADIEFQGFTTFPKPWQQCCQSEWRDHIHRRVDVGGPDFVRISKKTNYIGNPLAYGCKLFANVWNTWPQLKTVTKDALKARK